MPKTLRDQPLRDFGTTRQAAELLGINLKQVQRLCRDERIEFVRLGHDLLIYLPSLERYRETKSRRGRPPGKPSN